jgi:hypothetical protein
VRSASTPTVTVLLAEPPPPPPPPLVPGLAVLLELGATVVADAPDLEELLHPATITTAAATTTEIIHLLRSIPKTP